MSSYGLGFYFDRLHRDPTNHFLYVPYREQSSGASKMINAFSINQQNGNLTPIDTDVTGTSSIFDVKVLDIHDYNDPPVVNIQKPAQQYIDIDTGGRIFLNGSYSYDPDFGRCGGNPANFVYKWELSYVPPGSQKTSANIVNSNTLSSAYFDADVTGNYGFKLSFTDDHGTCPWMNKTTTAYLDVSLRKIKKTSEMVYKPDPIIPGNQGLIQWFPTRREGGQVYEIGYIYEYGLMCGGNNQLNPDGTHTYQSSWIATNSLFMSSFWAPKYMTQEQQFQYVTLATLASNFKCSLMLFCHTESLGKRPYDDTRKACGFALFGLEQWNPQGTAQTPVTEYGYWTYWSL